MGGNGHKEREFSNRKGKRNGNYRRTDSNMLDRNSNQEEVIESEPPKQTWFSILKRSTAEEQKVAQDVEVEKEIIPTTDKTNIEDTTDLKKNSKAPNLEGDSQEVMAQTEVKDTTVNKN